MFRVLRHHRPLRRYFVVLALATLVGVGALAGFNAIVDPPLDSRRQKTERLFRDQLGCAADGVIFGSSRLGIAGDVAADGAQYFNYAVDDMFPAEYAGYLDAYTQACGKAPARVVIGLDFFAASSNRYARADYPPPAAYIADATDPLWPVRKAFSLSILRSSVETLFRAGKANPFDRPAAPEIDEWRLNKLWYYRDVYRRFAFNEDLGAEFAALQRRFPDTSWLVLTTPVSEPVFELMLKHHLLPAYERWLEVAVSGFGRVHHFGGLNALTRSPRYFRDENHLHPRYAQALIRQALDAPSDASLPRDALTILTRESLPPYRDRLRRDAGL